MLRIGVDDLHPAVGEVIHARMSSMRPGQLLRAEDAGAQKVAAKRWKGIGQRILTFIPLGAAVGMAIVVSAGGSGGQVGLGAFMGAYFTGIITGVGSVLHAKFSHAKSVSGEDLRALAAGLDLPRADTVYLETVCALLEAGNNVSQQTGRDILTTLNDLLEQARYLDGRLERMRSAASTVSVQELEAERERIATRAGQVQDQQARDDLAQSLAICDERLRNARDLAPLIERLDAQREVILQTLLSVQSSVSRLQVAPAAISAPDVADVRRVVSEVTTQTKAVEDAVQQVMAIRS